MVSCVNTSNMTNRVFSMTSGYSEQSLIPEQDIKDVINPPSSGGSSGGGGGSSGGDGGGTGGGTTTGDSDCLKQLVQNKTEDMKDRIEDLRSDFQKRIDELASKVTALQERMNVLQDKVNNVIGSDGLILESAIPITCKINVGYILAWSSKEDPADMEKYLECDGSKIPTSENYDTLRRLLGSKNLPDLRGVYLRGYGSQTVNDGTTTVTHTSGELLSIQAHALLEHTHQSYTGVLTGDWFEYQPNTGTLRRITCTYGVNNAPVDTENRPVSAAVRWLIRAIL